MEQRNALSFSQAQIVKYPPSYDHILCIQAGPGSGKTFTVANRIAQLLRNGLKPEEILILSMTNRAVDSLSSHLRKLPDVDLDQLHISTFHSFCAGIIDEYDVRTVSTAPKRRLMDDLSWRNFSSIFLGKSISISGTKIDGNLTPTQLEKLLQSIKTGEVTVDQASIKFGVSKLYISELLSYLDKNGMMRYLDFIVDALDMLKVTNALSDQEKWLHQVANYKVVVVDEFQDMHHLLLNIIKTVVSYPTYDQPQGTCKHLTIAGDPNQCIYEFLGSSPLLIEQLHKEFPTMEIDQMSIKESFRLTPEILKVATEVTLQPNGLSFDKDLYSTKLPTFKPILYSRSSPSEEYTFIAEEISRLILQLGGLLKPSDFIILTRTNKEIDSIKSHLDAYGFKCKILSLINPWIKSKVHVFLDILNLLNNGTGSDFGLLCVIKLLDTSPGSRLRLSKLFVASETWRNGREIQALESFILHKSKELVSIYKTQPATLRSIVLFLTRLGEERQKIAVDATPQQIITSLFEIVNDTKIMDYLNFSSSEISAARPEQPKLYKRQLASHLDQFYDTLDVAYAKWKEHEQSSFLDYFLQTYNEDNNSLDQHSINISTVHTAKGLEFPIVFIPGSHNSYGSQLYFSNIFTDYPIEPEKARLFYVASTRASHLLYTGVYHKSSFRQFPQFIKDNFTQKLPDLQADVNKRGSLISNFSHNLNRPISPSHIARGTQLYSQLYRLLHTLSKKTFPRVV